MHSPMCPAPAHKTWMYISTSTRMWEISYDCPLTPSRCVHVRVQAVAEGGIVSSATGAPAVTQADAAKRKEEEEQWRVRAGLAVGRVPCCGLRAMLWAACHAVGCVPCCGLRAVLWAACRAVGCVPCCGLHTVPRAAAHACMPRPGSGPRPGPTVRPVSPLLCPPLNPHGPFLSPSCPLPPRPVPVPPRVQALEARARGSGSWKAAAYVENVDTKTQVRVCVSVCVCVCWGDGGGGRTKVVW
jgi:hypothetical protein